MDMAANSFDGNSDGYAYGPATFITRMNLMILIPEIILNGFWTNNKIETAHQKLNLLSLGGRNWC